MKKAFAMFFALTLTSLSFSAERAKPAKSPELVALEAQAKQVEALRVSLTAAIKEFYAADDKAPPVERFEVKFPNQAGVFEESQVLAVEGRQKKVVAEAKLSLISESGNVDLANQAATKKEIQETQAMIRRLLDIAEANQLELGNDGDAYYNILEL